MSAYRAHNSTGPAWTLNILAFFGVFCTAPVSAQFTSLAPTDSSELYVSSDRRQTGTDQPLHEKIFAFTPAGQVRLVASEPSPPVGLFGSTVACRYTNVSVSDDGKVLALTLSPDCGSGPQRTVPSNDSLHHGNARRLRAPAARRYLQTQPRREPCAVPLHPNPHGNPLYRQGTRHS
jgi:hypothetical protein